MTSGEYEPYDFPAPSPSRRRNVAALKLPAPIWDEPFKAAAFQTFLGRADYQINGSQFLLHPLQQLLGTPRSTTLGRPPCHERRQYFDDRNVTWASQWTSIFSPRRE